MKLIKTIMVLAYISSILFAANDRREAFSINRVNAVNIEATWKNQTDPATIILPRNVIDFDKNKVNHFFRKGDQVEIQLGYNGILKKEFTGYITEVSADVPITLKLEDEMWKIKQLPVHVSLQNTTLPNLMSVITPNYDYDALEIELGTVRYSKKTVGQVLKELKDQYGLYSYYQSDKLIVGKIYDDNENTHTIHLERDLVKNNLKFINGSDRLIKLKAVSVLFNGDKIEVEVGDTNGVERQLTYFNINSESELEKLAKLDYQKYKIDGLEGTIETFPYIHLKHGDKVDLISDLYPERNGLYYTDKVASKLTDSPMFHRIITIGPRVAL